MASEYYGPRAFLCNEYCSSAIVSLLFEVNSLTFELAWTDVDLDNSWTARVYALANRIDEQQLLRHANRAPRLRHSAANGSSRRDSDAAHAPLSPVSSANRSGSAVTLGSLERPAPESPSNARVELKWAEERAALEVSARCKTVPKGKDRIPTAMGMLAFVCARSHRPSWRTYDAGCRWRWTATRQRKRRGRRSGRSSPSNWPISRCRRASSCCGEHTKETTHTLGSRLLSAFMLGPTGVALVQFGHAGREVPRDCYGGPTVSDAGRAGLGQGAPCHDALHRALAAAALLRESYGAPAHRYAWPIQAKSFGTICGEG